MKKKKELKKKRSKHNHECKCGNNRFKTLEKDVRHQCRECGEIKE